ncbi:MAG: tetratricopeptide repeat protein [Rhodospirillaceae bacterium]|nr:tetratricopeptide repeat protein [Rhodospirillaceae bacterium]
MPAILNSKFKVLILVVGINLGLGGCSLMQGQMFDDNFWAGSPFHDNVEAELGIAELAKGNYITAEAHFKKALRRNPRDIDALIGAGILYQNTGQMTKAREMYEAVLALRPDEAQQFVVWNSITTKPASQIASVNLSLLESGITPSQQGIAGAAPGLLGNQPVSGAPAGSAMLGRAMPTLQPGPMASRAMTAPGASPGIAAYSGNDGNIMSRFATLKALRDQGLITAEEFARRRQTNIGALLPLTSPPPSAGLDRSVPTSEQIGGRLRAIGRALEMRAISVSQHAAERNMILDAMMPSAPVVVANPAVPPKGLMEAADSVRRLEKLRNDGFISSDEYARERQAIELSMRPSSPPSMAKAMPAKPVSQPAKLKKNASKGPSPAVHLASYRSMKQAQSGWVQIKRAHKAILGSLKSEVSKVNLGKKGTYYRLKAGPFKNASSAKSACGKLKRRRQFCEPSMMGAG